MHYAAKRLQACSHNVFLFIIPFLNIDIQYEAFVDELSIMCRSESCRGQAGVRWTWDSDLGSSPGCRSTREICQNWLHLITGFALEVFPLLIYYSFWFYFKYNNLLYGLSLKENMEVHLMILLGNYDSYLMVITIKNHVLLSA